MAQTPLLLQFHHLSFAQRAALGELRCGPQLEGGLTTQTFRALARRGLVEPVDERRPYCWALTPKGKRTVLALGLTPLPWHLRRPFGSGRTSRRSVSAQNGRH